MSETPGQSFADQMSSHRTGYIERMSAQAEKDHKAAEWQLEVQRRKAAEKLEAERMGLEVVAFLTEMGVPMRPIVKSGHKDIGKGWHIIDIQRTRHPEEERQSIGIHESGATFTVADSGYYSGRHIAPPNPPLARNTIYHYLSHTPAQTIQWVSSTDFKDGILFLVDHHRELKINPE